MRHRTKFRADRSNRTEIWLLSLYQNNGRPPSWILKFDILNAITVRGLVRSSAHSRRNEDQREPQ